MKKAIALALLVLASVALVACGSSGSDTTSSGETGGGAEKPAEEASGGGGGAEAGGSIVQIATPSGTELTYITKEAGAKAGQVSIEFENPQELQHDVAVEDSSGKVLGKTELVAGGSATTTIKDLKPGTYTFFCTVPGHREAGMEGTLTVK